MKAKFIFASHPSSFKDWKTEKKLIETTSLGEITAYLEKGASEKNYEENLVQESPSGYSKTTMTKDPKKRTVAENVVQYKLSI